MRMVPDLPGQEIEQRLVDILGVGPVDVVWATCKLDEPHILHQIRQTPTGGVVQTVPSGLMRGSRSGWGEHMPIMQDDHFPNLCGCLRSGKSRCCTATAPSREHGSSLKTHLLGDPCPRRSSCGEVDGRLDSRVVRKARLHGPPVPQPDRASGRPQAHMITAMSSSADERTLSMIGSVESQSEGCGDST